MPTAIFANNLPINMRPEAYDAAVRQGLKARYSEYRAQIISDSEHHSVEVRIESEKGQVWSRIFRGLEVSPENIQQTIEQSNIP